MQGSDIGLTEKYFPMRDENMKFPPYEFLKV